jgi:hypothetical protein
VIVADLESTSVHAHMLGVLVQKALRSAHRCAARAVQIGVSSFMWRQQHVVGHHAYTNLACDPDIRVSEHDVRRVAPYHPKQPYHVRYQQSPMQCSEPPTWNGHVIACTRITYIQGRLHKELQDDRLCHVNICLR